MTPIRRSQQTGSDNAAPAPPASRTVREKRSVPAARVTARPARIRPATEAELQASLPTYVATRLVQARPNTVGGEADPAEAKNRPRRLTVDKPLWARLDRAHVVAAPEARLWIAGTAAAAASQPRIKLGKHRNLDLAEHGSVELGSSDSQGTILVPHQLLVVPVEVSLPLLPAWLRGLVGTLRRHSRLGLDQFKEENPVLLTRRGLRQRRHWTRPSARPRAGPGTPAPDLRGRPCRRRRTHESSKQPTACESC